MRDLGLVRWGYDLTAPEKDKVVQTVKALFQEVGADLSLEASIFATRMDEARHDVGRCMVICAVLWALGRFDEIVRLVEECRANVEGEWPPSLSVIQVSAEIKTGTLTQREAKQERIDRLEELKSSLSEKERLGILLGVGYVEYHAWKQETLGDRIKKRRREDLPADVQEWARLSFASGEEAAYLLPSKELAWAFALNHCAYVGIVTGLEPEKTEDYFRELLKLQNFPAFWNCRFEDTLGFYYLMKIERTWDETLPERRSELKLDGDIDSAGRHFKRAKECDLGDIDLDEHIDRLDHMKSLFFSAKANSLDVSD
jgi:hypothetical protein